jgi:glycosyltransferase involved in cell wall biosynthesis
MRCDSINAAIRVTGTECSGQGLPMNVQVSVVICTHNPRKDFLERTLQGLKLQTLPTDRWELLIIDNASVPAVEEFADTVWHPRARIVREPRLGLTPARLRGIKESVGDLLVLTDDDNVLAPDYLEQALRIGEQHPFLGAWGGSAIGEFEVPVPEWAGPWIHFVAVHVCKRAIWTNEPYRATPHGAGMCIRKHIAVAYATATMTDPARLMLGRSGTSLMGCEDTEMADSSFEHGLGVGTFPQLVLTHIIAGNRLTKSYFLKAAEGREASIVLMKTLRGETVPHPLSDNLVKRWLKWLRLPLLPRMQRRMALACMRGYRQGMSMVRELGLSTDGSGKRRAIVDD